MKQLLQNLASGKTELVEEPKPHLKNGHVLVQTRASLISAGTERMLVEFGKAGYISKAKSQPDKARQVLEKIKTDGLVPTIKAVRAIGLQGLRLAQQTLGEAFVVNGMGFTRHP
jgi:hypothetical protein